MRKVIHMVTLSRSIPLMRGQLEYLQDKGYNTGVLSSAGTELDNQNACFKRSIEMERNIYIIKDIKSLINLINYFRKQKPDIVNAGTPKAGLLGIIASYITRVPNRIYTMRGLRMETTSGIKKWILWFTEKIACSLSTEVICISPSLLERAKELKLIKNKGIILNKGSSNGLELSDFPLPEDEKVRVFVNDFYSKHRINKKDFVIGFVGRLTRDKGINELIEIFNELSIVHPNIKLIILGSIEPELNSEIFDVINNHSSIHYLGHIDNPSLYYYLLDILVFPTHREGFGNVSIQAQAASVPVITTNATGARDTIINNETGLIYPTGNKELLKSSIMKFYCNSNMIKKYGRNARLFVEQNFQSIVIWNELGNIYDSYFN